MVEARERPLSLSYRRPADTAERAALEGAFDELQLQPKADLAEVGSGVGLGVLSLIFIGPLVLLLAWGLEVATGLSFGTDRSWAVAALFWLFAWGGMGLIRVVSKRARMSAAKRALAADIASEEVIEESWRFVEAVGFQEAERLPLLYVLHADNGAAVAFEETKLLGRERAPNEAVFSAAPSDAVLVRGAKSGLLVSENYSGPPLPILEIHHLALPREERPAHGTPIDRPWGSIAAWLSGRSRHAS
jgi:hypothetical protein